MAYSLQYFDEVEADIRKAKLWYKEIKNGLETEFAKSIEAAIERILENPKTYAVRYKKVRIAHPRIFPFNILFTLTNVIKSK